MRHVYGFSYDGGEFGGGVPYVFVLADCLQAAVSVYARYAEFCRREYDPEFIGPDTKGVSHQMRVAADVAEDGEITYAHPFTRENFTGGCDDQLANFRLDENGRAVP